MARIMVVPETDGIFITSDGRVLTNRSRNGKTSPSECMRELTLYRRTKGCGYYVVCFRPNPGDSVECRYVHRLVLEAFVGPCPIGMEACHNDGDTSNNQVDNLRWDTRSSNHMDKEKHGTSLKGKSRPDLAGDNNALHRNPELAPRGEEHGMSVLTEEVVRLMREEYARGLPGTELARKYGCSRGTVYRAIRRQTWKHVV